MIPTVVVPGSGLINSDSGSRSPCWPHVVDKVVRQVITVVMIHIIVLRGEAKHGTCITWVLHLEAVLLPVVRQPWNTMLHAGFGLRLL